MTKGNSMSYGTRYGNFIRGNRDKLMISYRREPSHDYTMAGACGVLFQGEIHFFGGRNYSSYGIDFSRQHFVIETKRSGQLVKMSEKKDLETGFYRPSCSSFEITNVVILCFDYEHRDINKDCKSCFSFDGKLAYISDSNYEHYIGGLTKYKEGLLTVGGFNQKTEILKIDENKNFDWSVLEIDLKFTPGYRIFDHSLVTVESSDINEEYVLLIGGRNEYLRWR